MRFHVNKYQNATHQLNYREMSWTWCRRAGGEEARVGAEARGAGVGGRER